MGNRPTFKKRIIHPISFEASTLKRANERLIELNSIRINAGMHYGGIATLVRQCTEFCLDDGWGSFISNYMNTAMTRESEKSKELISNRKALKLLQKQTNTQTEQQAKQ
jgi:hypothetical protein